MRAMISTALLILLSAAATARAAQLHVTDRSDFMWSSKPAEITVTGVKPDSLVTLTLTTKDAAGHTWKSQATYHADLSGTLSVEHVAPLKGSYRGIDPMGLFWSMRPQNNKHEEFTPPAKVMTYTLTAKSHGQEIGTATLTRKAMAAGIEIRKIRKPGFVADLYLPKKFGRDGKRHPAVITLGGAEGGIGAADGFAAWLSSRGFVVLALAWYRMPSLPQNMVHVPVNVIKKGLDFLNKQSFVNADQIGLLGGSWGGILALFSASHMPRIHAVVSWLGGPVIAEGLERDVPPAGYKPVHKSPFLYRGKPVPFVSYRILLKFMHTENWKLINAAFIPVWRIHGPILFVTGGDDKLEFSALQALWATKQLKRHGHSYADRVLFYPNAGHLISLGYLPTSTRADFNKYIPVGGTPRGYAEADRKVGPQVVGFLRQALSVGHS